jgi:hypothetical protein
VERRADSAFARIACQPQALVDGARHVMVLKPCSAQMPPRPQPEDAPPPPKRQPERGPSHDHASRPAAAAARQPASSSGSAWCFALMLNMLPLGRTAVDARLPGRGARVLERAPAARIGVVAAFLFGLAIDVHQAALLGQHALAYTRSATSRSPSTAACCGSRCRRRPCRCCRCSWRRMPIEMAIRMLAGGLSPAHAAAGAVLEAALWPVVSVLLLRRSAERPIRTKIGPYETLGTQKRSVDCRLERMTELRNVEQDCRASAAGCWRPARPCCCASSCWRRAWCTCRCPPRGPDEQAENNRTAIVPIVPNRGLILDRNGIVLATNYSAYTLEITPSRKVRPTSTRPSTSWRRWIDIQARDKRRFKKLLEESKSIDSLPIRTKLTDEEVARFTAQRFRFPGVEIKARLFRNYPLGEVASHAIGYIGRINQTEKKQMEDWPEDEQANYRGTEYIGKLGVEQSYERELHGVTGVEEVETSAGGRAVRKLKPARRHAGQHGQAVDRHQAAEAGGRAVRRPPRRAGGARPEDRRDPGLRQQADLRPQPVRRRHRRRRTGALLNESIDKPLLNRALRGTYPPGSTFKPFMALAALEHRQAHARSRHLRPRLLLVRQPQVPRRQGRRPRRDRHVQVDRAVQQPTTTCWPTTWAWT